jgi:hypothetical protein
MVVLSRESIHKVKTFDGIMNLRVDFIQNYPIIIVIEIIGKNGRFVAMVSSQPI